MKRSTCRGTIKHRDGLWLAALLVVAQGSGCEGQIDEETVVRVGSYYPVQWGPADDPQLLGEDLNKQAAQLPAEGRADKVPWPSSYWPTYLDSINYKWAGAGSESASSKYGRAFGVANLEQLVSTYAGILGQRARRSCRSDSQCDRRQNEVCGKRSGESSGRCIPQWWGLCHAWAPASILEPEPAHAVTLNGVTFEVNDIKALATLVYDRSEYKFVSLRCQDSNALGEISFDEYGRPTGNDSACQDTNPGTYHLLLTNYLGIKRRALIEDRIFDAQVWNQPILAYHLDQQREVSASEANALVGASGSSYRFSTAAVSFLHVKIRVEWVREAAANAGTDHPLVGEVGSYTGTDNYEYVLELAADGQINGGEWLGKSKQNHPDFLWLPVGVGATAVASGAIQYQQVKQLLDLASNPATAVAPATPTPSATAPQHLNVSGSVRQGESRTYQAKVVAGRTIVIRTQAPNDVDLFVRLNVKPTTQAYDARSIGWGGDEQLTFNPTGDGVLQIMVYGYRASSFTLTTADN